MNPYEIKEKFPLRTKETLTSLCFFADDHLSETLQDIVQPLRDTAFALVEKLSDGPELTVALRRLVDAKDSFLRCYVVERNFRVRY